MLYKITEIKEDKKIDKLLDKEGVQAKVARLSGVSESYVSLLRQGKRIASEEIYNKLKNVLDKM